MPHADDRPDAWAPLLERGRWFSSLSPEDRAALLRVAVLRRLPAGATLFERGDANAGLFAVLDGAVSIGASDAGARETVLGVLDPPQWFGEIACVDGGPRTHDAVARAATTLLLVPLAELEALAAADPRWWRHLGRLMSEKVRALFVALEDQGRLPAPARIARRLVAMATGHGMRAPGLSQRSVSVNQEQLGAMLSLTRQTVSEVLREFEARGLVRRRYGEIEILDEATLAREGEPAGR